VGQTFLPAGRVKAMQKLSRILAAAVLATMLNGCSPVTALNALASTDPGYGLALDVAYGSEARQRLDIYIPTSPAPSAGWPVVVFYGGTWNSGNKDDYKFVGAALAARGALTLVADYRLFPEVRYPEFLKDSAMALSWSLANAGRFGGDPKRLFVMGYSEGAYNAAMLALDSRWLRAVGRSPSALAGWIGLAGPYDFLPTDDPLMQSVFLHPNYPARVQPMEFVSAAAPATFLGASEKDKVVDTSRSTRELARKLELAGAPVSLRIYARPSHAELIGAFSPPLRWLAPVLADIIEFIDRPPTARPPAGPSRR